MSFKGKHKADLNQNPGPGEYDHSLANSNDKGVKIGSARRPDNFLSNFLVDLPGPGQHNPFKPKTTISVSFMGKYNGKKDMVPGPGTYHLMDELESKMRSNRSVTSTKGSLPRDSRRTE